MPHFETKVDQEKLELMLRGGATVTEAAKHFGVTAGRISQLKKKMKTQIVRVSSFEKAAQSVESHLDVVSQLRRINSTVTDELIAARESARNAVDAKERRANQRLVIELSREIRSQLDSQMKILELWHDAKIVAEFQNEILNILDEVKPGLRHEIIERLKQGRALRETVSFDRSPK